MVNRKRKECVKNNIKSLAILLLIIAAITLFALGMTYFPYVCFVIYATLINIICVVIGFIFIKDSLNG